MLQSMKCYIVLSFTGDINSKYSSSAFASEPWFMILLGSIAIMLIVLVFVGIIAYRKHCWSPLHQKQASLNRNNHGATADIVVGRNGVSLPVNRPGFPSNYDQVTQR